MPPVACGELRQYLQAVRQGTPYEPTPGLSQLANAYGAIRSGPGTVELTPVGERVLRELTVRAPRADGCAVEEVGNQISRILADLDGVAKTAEYFLGELGPLVPQDAAPLLRPTAIGLASRRGEPEELAERFRAAWGGVEVIRGDNRDRLLAAELMEASGVDLETGYAPVARTADLLRESEGPTGPVITVAALLELGAEEPARALDRFRTIRSWLRLPEVAAVASLLPESVAPELDRIRSAVTSAAPGQSHPNPDSVRVDVLLLAHGISPKSGRDRLATFVEVAKSRFDPPDVPAALLSVRPGVGPEELLHWVDEAGQVVQRRMLAPTPSEVAALALGLVHRIPGEDFRLPGEPPVTEKRSRLAFFCGLIALHAWVYRRAIPSAGASARPIPNVPG
ncbi:MAG: hypothetical protein L3K14_03410 [Thermoplasmata archaeon]|nr:hypothetical protein [Thermoplasmata archaeon]